MTRAHTDPGSPAEAHQVQEADQPPEVTVILPKAPALLTQPAAKALPAFICDEYLHHHTTHPSADHPRLGEYTVDGWPSGRAVGTTDDHRPPCTPSDPKEDD
jgi:hypothetical protein